MGVGGEDGSEGGVIQEGTPEKPRTPPNEIRENAEGGLPAPYGLEEYGSSHGVAEDVAGGVSRLLGQWTERAGLP